MKKIESILLAIDFSQGSKDALKSAVFLAAKNRSKIHLLHVIPPLYGWNIDQSSILRDAEGMLAEYVEEIHQGGVSETHAVALFGNPHEEIVGRADSLDVNLIMIGSGEKDEGDRFPLGTTAENIIRGSFRPVWVVKRGASPGMRKIICPVDFSEHSRRALVNAVNLSRMFAAELQVLTVAEKMTSVYRGMALHSANIQADWEKHIRKELDKFLDSFDFGGIVWDKVLRTGKPHEEVLKAAAETGSDMIVMGSLGRKGLVRILMGSVAEKIARELPCSLIMMKAPDLIE
jgi:nucleotide-binding universal stress UspA family protein